MNAPGKRNVSIEDKYALETGQVYISGIQALVRLPIMMRQRDLAHGLNTAGFISGYRGSPLAAYDLELWRARKFLKENHIHFEPGLNEDLAATSVWGSQQTGLFPGAKYDGVFGMWYGKGPGVDRTVDVLRHANAFGTAQYGGVLAILGDDHGAVSSSLPHQTEHICASVMMPVLHPATVQEYFDLGILGFEMSRYSGCWVGFTALSETVESAQSAWVDPYGIKVAYPKDFDMPEGGLHIRWPDDRIEMERRLQRHKVFAAIKFARANKLDKIVIDSDRPRIGIITTGKGYLDVRQALQDLGITDELAAHIGLRVYKVAMTWPLEREGARHFAEGLDEVIVIEEKRALIENQLKEQLYNWRADVRPRLVGKYDEFGEDLLPPDRELTPALVARVIAKRLKPFYTSPQIDERLAFLNQKDQQLLKEKAPIIRTPYYCAGCPHNTSTKVPEGSKAMAGIGCHFMVQWMNRETATYTQMGGEGASWIGMAPFTEMPHIFQNLGDGTYQHSGILALRAAVSAKAPITYKILYNDAVAMTGGQPVEGTLTVPGIAYQVYGEGVRKIALVSDNPGKFDTADFPPDIQFYHRDEMDHVQKLFRQYTDGVSVIIYEQTCAAEKRRRRKRGQMEDPPQRIFINDAVCEGCGDCSDQSNCVAVEPLETELGRKRQINQSSCNKDYSCVNGFCPSFVTIDGGSVRKPASKADHADEDALFASLAEPVLPSLSEPYSMLVTGIGGTGVVTIGQIVGMAAHIEQKGTTVLDFTGLAQKNGAVLSHVRIGEKPEDLYAVRIAKGNADLILGCDMVVAASSEALAKASYGNTQAVINSHETPTASFVQNGDMDMETQRLKEVITHATGGNSTEFLDATAIATALFGDAIATNMFMLGYAYQRGLVPVTSESLMNAIALNGVAVDWNQRAFQWGRLAAHDFHSVQEQAQPKAHATEAISQTFEEAYRYRIDYLTAYQDLAYAKRYQTLIEKIRAEEEARCPGETALTDAVMRNYFKLMAYKDEYEVARLYSGATFQEKLTAAFEGDFRLKFHISPPLFAPRDPHSGLRKKLTTDGKWLQPAFKVLSKLKGLRGTAFDPFGYQAERKLERQLIADYEQLMTGLCQRLDADSHSTIVELAKIPQKIRGFGHIKARNLALARAEEERLLAQLKEENPLKPKLAAE